MLRWWGHAHADDATTRVNLIVDKVASRQGP